MASARLIEKLHVVKGLDAVADAFSGTVTSDIVNMKLYGDVTFVIHKGVGTTGTSTVTVEACDDVAGTNVTAIPFHYRAITAEDTEGALTVATAAGFVTTAGSSQLYVIETDDSGMALTNYTYIRLKMVEVVDSPVLGGILILQSEARYGGAVKDSTIV